MKKSGSSKKSTDKKKKKNEEIGNEKAKGVTKVTRPKKAKKPKAIDGSNKEEETLMKKYKDLLSVEPLERPIKEAHKITDLKNTTDVTVDSVKAKSLGMNAGTTRDTYEATKKKRLLVDVDSEQKAVVRKLIPKRANQTKNTLAIYNIHGKENDYSRGIDGSTGSTDIYSELRNVNSLIHQKERNMTQFPLEKLVTLGLLTAHVPSLNDRQYSMSRQFKEDADFMRNQLEQLTRTQKAQPVTTLVKTTPTTARSNKKTTLIRSIHQQQQQQQQLTISETKQGNPKLTSVTVKLGLLCGNLATDFGYRRSSSKTQINHIFKEFDDDKERRRREFFQSDPIEDETPFCSIPSRYHMFEELREQNAEKNKKHDEVMKDQSLMVAKSDLEVINRDDFLEYRRRPRTGEAICLEGTNCLFYTITNDPDLRYIGRVFYTPNQAKLVETGQFEREGLCIDCLLFRWTLHVQELSEKVIAQKVAINHFTVMTGVGQYNKKCMLDVTFNNLTTGIVGCVPKYSENYRNCKGIATFRDPIRNITQQERYISESNMDF